MDKPRIYVDFNEMAAHDIVLLSQEDYKEDSDGNIITFYEGMPVSIYSGDADLVEGEWQPDNLIADGIATRCDLSKISPDWVVKWCCRIDENGIRHESDLRG